MSTGLSIAALALSALALLVAFATYRRDRPKLALKLTLGGTDEGFVLDVTVVNDGRHPVTLGGLFIGFGPPEAPQAMARLSQRIRFVLFRFLMRAHACPRWLQRLLADKPDEANESGIPTTGVGAPDLTEPILLMPGESRTFTFTNARLRVLGHGHKLYVGAVDVLGRTTRTQIPDWHSRFLFGQG